MRFPIARSLGERGKATKCHHGPHNVEEYGDIRMNMQLIDDNENSPRKVIELIPERLVGPTANTRPIKS
ncbi:MAG TPA: hypothetical protein PKA02_04210 [Candidatus Saccharibacteria bacterium]|nr:hypothetical protein [Candidatus Saccharibacteria bacterium]